MEYKIKTKTFGNCRVYPDNPQGPVPSVTSICGSLMKYGLIDWAANCAVDYIEQYSVDLWKSFTVGEPHGTSRGLRTCQCFLDDARQAHNRIKEDAGEKGTDVHDFCRQYLMRTWPELRDSREYQDSSEIIKKMLESFIAWVVKEEIEVVATEVKVHGDGYSGRCDLIAHREGKLCLYDIKTTPAYYPEQGLQLAAYAEAWDKTQVYNWYKKGAGFHEGHFIPEIQEIGIIRLDKKTGSCNFSETGRGPHFTEHRKRLTEAFMALKDFYWLYNNLEGQLKGSQ